MSGIPVYNQDDVFASLSDGVLRLTVERDRLIEERDHARRVAVTLEQEIGEVRRRLANRTHGLRGDLATDVREILKQVFGP